MTKVKCVNGNCGAEDDVDISHSYHGLLYVCVDHQYGEDVIIPVRCALCDAPMIDIGDIKDGKNSQEK